MSGVELMPAVGVRFLVQVDSVDLGLFTSCEGLGVEVVVEQRNEGGNNAYLVQIPSRLKFPNIKLTRPLTRETERVAKWISGLASGVQRRTGQITAMTSDGTVVARWGLIDVIPVRWTGPTFAKGPADALTETIEIAHHGFIDTGV
ncbi:phage tail protein [Kribbella sandramycini]|uniref:Phage tail protein n=1 Tax=Kribbella sandramycini TaxID=60450 RepID=A0A7Y4P4M9_9ACTN|nr:phage tail protein [Kribbella sandramycini]MBB6570119.1 phage tail-like protein [Kribbella sandramycini]NOL45379.1 phage tail protein [Kribbella sandramycini]